jgi:tetraacyldisaccharide 4'-kinase
MENFAEIASKFAEAGALVPIDGAAELAGAVRGLLDDGPRRERIGAAARTAAESERGATARAAGEIARLYAASLPRYRPAAPVLIALWPLSRLWLAGGTVKRWLNSMRQSRLATPVISIGGLAVGGTGKTPLVLWLAERLKERGHQPAILTRGYRRRIAESHTIIAPGERAPAERTGDEAQIYVRAAVGPLGIGADRAGAARLIEERFVPQVFLLDDGFQHGRLARSLDIVVLDALDPFGGGAPIPLGRLRESLAALGRADAIVVTRTAPGDNVAAIEARVRRYNAKAPVFASRVAVRGWRDAAGQVAPLPPRVAAFCGLGNPDSFWRTLRELGVAPVWRRAFGDHHRYSRQELVGMAAGARAAGAEALLTTEKDVANLDAGWQEALGGLAVLWLEIGIEIDQAEALIKLAEAPLSRSSRNRLRSSPPP